MDGPDWVPLDRDSWEASRPEASEVATPRPPVPAPFEHDRPWLDRHPDRRRLDLVAIVAVFVGSAAVVVVVLTGVLVAVGWMFERLP